MERAQSPIQALLDEGKYIYIAAPMVRYSKLPFRLLCRKWGCDVTYTPMIVAKDFVNSPITRRIEFSTNAMDRPLVTQFAANDPVVLAKAVEYVAGHCDGVDINCGCPQTWVMNDGYGASLLDNPQIVKEMVMKVNEIASVGCSIKIRISDDIKKTLDLVQQAEMAGVKWITVHGRTKSARSSAPVNYDAIRLVKEVARVPIFGNGHCFTLEDATLFREKTGVDGIMAARGLLENPALFKGYKYVPRECVDDWCRFALFYTIPLQIFHQQLMHMLDRFMTKEEKTYFHSLVSVPSMVEFLRSQNYLTR